MNFWFLKEFKNINRIIRLDVAIVKIKVFINIYPILFHLPGAQGEAGLNGVPGTPGDDGAKGGPGA